MDHPRTSHGRDLERAAARIREQDREGERANTQRPVLLRAFVATCLAVSVLALLAAIVDIVVSALYLSNVSHVSGAWTVLARDTSRGVFYRPLFHEQIGYGGTRFMPLFFVLHAVLINLGIPAIAGGVALSILAGALMLAAVIAILRIRRVSWFAIVVSLAALLSFIRVREGFTSIRGDVLPVALGLWGAYAFLRAYAPRREASRGTGVFVLAGALFALAFFAKLTSLFALSAALAASLLSSEPWRRRIHAAGTTLVSFLVFAGTFFAVVETASGGSFSETFATSAAAGATDLRLRTIIRDGIGGLAGQWRSNQVGFRVLLVAGTLTGIWALTNDTRFARKPDVPPHGRGSSAFEPLLFFFTLMGTIAILSSPGAAGNHLIDAMVAGILLLAVHLDRLMHSTRRPRYTGAWRALVVPGLLLAVVLLGAKTNLPYLMDHADRRPRYTALSRAIADDELVLAEDPSILIHAGKPVRMVDSFMLRVVREQDPSVSRFVLDEVRDGVYDAILLMSRESEAAAEYLGRMHFGRGFLETLDERYERVEVIAGTELFRPRGRGE